MCNLQLWIKINSVDTQNTRQRSKEKSALEGKSGLYSMPVST